MFNHLRSRMFQAAKNYNEANPDAKQTFKEIVAAVTITHGYLGLYMGMWLASIEARNDHRYKIAPMVAGGLATGLGIGLVLSVPIAAAGTLAPRMTLFTLGVGLGVPALLKHESNEAVKKHYQSSSRPLYSKGN